jgi:RsiW-degrading membrane proteinase PrsW (M82 family)
MLQQMLGFFVGWFSNPNLTAMSVALLLGLFWYALYRPPLRGYTFLWLISAAAAVLAFLSVVLVQIPLQTLVGMGLAAAFDPATIMTWLYVLGIPSVALSGLVQEAAKLLPILYIWRQADAGLAPKVGLIAGAAAGAGFGVFEAMWALNQAYAGGWTIASIQGGGFAALAPLWERFFTVGGHIAFSALAGYGLATDRGWRFYFIAAGLHSLLNYTVVLLQAQLISLATLEILAAILCVAATAWALVLRHTGEGAPWTAGYRRRLHLGKEPKEYA